MPDKEMVKTESEEVDIFAGIGYEACGNILKSRGLAGIDPRSNEGKYITQKAEEYATIADPTIPKAMVLKLVQMAVEVEILKDQLLSQLLKLRLDTGHSEKSRARRQAFQAGTTAYRGYVALSLQLMGKIRGEKSPEEDKPETFFDRLEKLQKGKDVSQKAP